MRKIAAIALAILLSGPAFAQQAAQVRVRGTIAALEGNKLTVTAREGDKRVIELAVRGKVPGIDDAAFQEAANGAKLNCPLSKALAAVKDIRLEATLET